MDALLILFCVVYYYLTFTDAIAISSCVNEYPTTKSGYFNSLKRIIDLKKENEILSDQPGVTICTGNIEKPKLEGEIFEFQKIRERNVLIFSAFHETRPQAKGPSIKVVSVGWQRAYQDVGDLWCILWYYDRMQGVSVGPAEYENIFPSTLHHDMWCEHFIICPLPEGVKDIPYGVSITDAPCSTPDNYVYISNRGIIEKKGKFAVCYPAVYGRYTDWRMVVEFFVFQRLLGAEEITIYNYLASNETSITLEYFQRLGWVNVIPWPYPGLPTHTFFQRATINDCINRYMHRYDYVAVHDLDELLIPRSFKNWLNLLRSIGQPDHGAYLFQHLYFRRNNTPITEEELFSKKSMITLSSFFRTHEITPPGKIRCKTMYKTDKVLKADLHFPYHLVPGAKEYIVNAEDGILHHYRESPMESFQKHPDKYKFIEDRYVEAFSEKLVNAYQNHMKKVMTLIKLYNATV